MGSKRLTEDQRQVNKKWSQYRSGARTRGLTFELTKADFEGIIKKPCYYCGVEPSPLNGVDRRDNSKGYNLVNSVPCCTVCNMMKRVLPEIDWYHYIYRAYRYIFGSTEEVPEDRTLEEIGITLTKGNEVAR